MTNRTWPNSASLLGTSTRRLLLTGSNPAQPRERILQGGRIRFGSAAHCTVRVTGKAVPRVACLVLNGQARTVVRSFWSAVCLNGRRFEQAVLQPGDRLTVGSYALRLADSLPGAGGGAGERSPTRRQTRLWRRRARRLRAKLRRLSRHRGRLESQMREARARMHSALTTAAETVADHHAAHALLTERLAAAQAELTAQRVAAEHEHAGRQAAEGRLALADDERQALHSQLAAVEGALSQARRALDERLAAEAESQVEREQAAKAELLRLHSLLELAEADRASVQVAYERAANDWRRREAQAAEEAALLAVKLTAAATHAQEQALALAAADENIRRHAAESAARRRECEELQAALNQAAQERAALGRTLQGEHDALLAECRQLRGELDQPAQSLEDARASLIRREDELESSLSRQQALENDLAEERKILAAAEELLVQAAQERAALELTLNAEHEALLAECLDLRAELERRTQALEAARTSLGAREHELESCRLRQQELEDDLAEARTARAAAEGLLAQAVQERGAATEAELSAERTARAEERRRLQSELTELAQALVGAEAGVEQRARVCAELEAARQALTAELAARESACATWQAEREKLIAAGVQAGAESECERAARDALQRQFERTLAEQHTVAAELEEARRSLASANDLLAEFQAREAALQSAIASQREQCAEIERQRDALQASLDESQRRGAETQDRARECQTEADRLREELARIRAQAAARATEHEQAFAQASQQAQAVRDEQQETEIFELRAAAVELRRRCGDLEDREGRLQEELDSVRSELGRALSADLTGERPAPRWGLESAAPPALSEHWDDDATAQRGEEIADERGATDADREAHRAYDLQLDRLADLRREWEQARRQRRGDVSLDREPSLDAAPPELQDQTGGCSDAEEAPPASQSPPLDTLDVLRRYGFAAENEADEHETASVRVPQSIPEETFPLDARGRTEGEAAVSDEDEHASSVDEYMRRLLARVGARSDSLADSASANPARGSNSARQSHSSAAASEPAAREPAAEPTESPPELAAAAYVRRAAPERKSDLSALREVANQSSHLHLAKSNSRSLATQAQMRGLLWFASLLVSGGLLWCHALGIPYSLPAAAGAGVVSAVALTLYLKTVWRSWSSKIQLTPPAGPEPAQPEAAESPADDSLENPGDDTVTIDTAASDEHVVLAPHDANSASRSAEADEVA